MGRNVHLVLIAKSSFLPVLGLLITQPMTIENEILKVTQKGAAESTCIVANWCDYSYYGLIRCYRNIAGREELIIAYAADNVVSITPVPDDDRVCLRDPSVRSFIQSKKNK